MLNDIEIHQWAVKYPDLLRNVYKKGIYYYVSQLPFVGLTINRRLCNGKIRCWGRWDMRQWLVYLIVTEKYEEALDFVNKYELFFSELNSYSSLIQELHDNAEKCNLAKSREIEEVWQRIYIRSILGKDCESKRKIRISHSTPHM